jgi:O-antigen ligase
MSVRVTIDHPLLGVGPGMFGDATASDQTAREAKLAWRQTHNTYTQISSECGIPALLFYLFALVYAMRFSLRAGRRLRSFPGLKRLADTADALFLALLLFAVGACFGSFAYSFYFPVLAGVAGAFERAVNNELALAAAQASTIRNGAGAAASHALCPPCAAAGRTNLATPVSRHAPRASHGA